MQHTSLQSLLYLLIYATYVIAISLISTYLCNIRHCNLSYIYLFMQHTSLQSLLYLLIYATYVIAISLISTYLCNIRHCSGTCLTRHTKGPWSDCTGCRNTQVLFQLTELLWDHKFLSDVTGCWKTQVSDCTGYTVYTYLCNWQWYLSYIYLFM
jgi:hypothetical protein